MNKIPKIIHYCWFGRGKMPDSALKYIESWKKYCPDYEIKEWNEDTFDITSNVYVKEAYECKKYAFVTDYVRLYALYNYGGIYMDTDVEVLKPLDEFLKHKAFSSFENNNSIPTGIMASEKNGTWVKKLLDEYIDIHFIMPNGNMDLTTNVTRITNLTEKEYGLIKKSSYQDLGDVTIYPHEYFCPKDWETGEIFLTSNTYTIHHFNASWHSKQEKKYTEIKRKLIKEYGKEKGIEKFQKIIKRKSSINRILTLPYRCIKKMIRIIKRS